MKKIIDKKTIFYLAKLAQLKIKEKEVSVYQKQLEEILNYVKILKKINTSQCLPVYQTTKTKNVYQEDRQEDSFSVKEVLLNASKKFKKYFKTKAVF